MNRTVLLSSYGQQASLKTGANGFYIELEDEGGNTFRLQLDDEQMEGVLVFIHGLSEEAEEPPPPPPPPQRQPRAVQKRGPQVRSAQEPPLRSQLNQTLASMGGGDPDEFA